MTFLPSQVSIMMIRDLHDVLKNKPKQAPANQQRLQRSVECLLCDPFDGQITNTKPKLGSARALE